MKTTPKEDTSFVLNFYFIAISIVQIGYVLGLNHEIFQNKKVSIKVLSKPHKQ